MRQTWSLTQKCYNLKSPVQSIPFENLANRCDLAVSPSKIAVIDQIVTRANTITFSTLVSCIDLSLLFLILCMPISSIRTQWIKGCAVILPVPTPFDLILAGTISTARRSACVITVTWYSANGLQENGPTNVTLTHVPVLILPTRLWNAPFRPI